MTERPDGPELTNPRAERVRMVRGLAGRSARRRHGQFLVEGPQGVREAVRHAPRQVRDVYLTADAAARHPEIPAAARAARLHLHQATAEVLAAMSADAQGVLAVAHSEGPTTTPRLAEILALRDGAGPRLVAVLAHVSDPGNAGTLVRAADAAGADAVVLGPGSVELLNPKVVRATAGSLFHLPVLTAPDLPNVLTALRGRGLSVLAADAAGEWDLDDLAEPAAGTTAPDLRAPTAWLFGNEAHGLAPEQRALAAAGVRVPIHGQAESLNLATAAAVCLYASARAQR